MNNDLMFSSKTDMWSTPQATFDKYNAVYNFNLDVCATAENAKVSKFYTEADNGLVQKWEGVCWMNPPYGDAVNVCKSGCKNKKCIEKGEHNYIYIYPGSKTG